MAAARHMPPAGGVPSLRPSHRAGGPDGLDQSWQQCDYFAIARMQQCRTMRVEIENPRAYRNRYRRPARSQLEFVECDADPLILTPDNATRNTRAVRLKVKVETFGDTFRIRDFQRSTRDRHVAD